MQRNGLAALSAVEAWEAHAERDIGIMMARYLVDHPPPGASRIADEILDWADRLQAEGEGLLEAAGLRALRAV